MQSVSTLLGLAVVLFLSTNVDDFVVLIAFFANPSFRARDIVAGQYAGTAALFAVSVAGALFSLVIPEAYVGLLGIFPILVGIRKLLELRHDRAEDGSVKNLDVTTGGYGKIANVALVTMANGGDNIGVYIPAFAVHSGSQVAIIASVFVAMTALLCMLAHWMVSHPRLGAPLRRYGHILAPLVLIALGILIIYDAGSLPSLLGPIYRRHSLVRRIFPATPTLLAL
jgi:cadmium resistance protein CadD (predicted permease)